MKPLARAAPNAAPHQHRQAYLARGAGLTGAADSKRLTFAAWVYVTAGLGARLISSVTTLGGGAPGTRCVLSAAENRFSIAGMNAAGTQICSIESSPIPFGRWVHLMGSVDLSDPSKRHLYVNGATDLANVNTYTDDVMDFTMADWGVGGYGGGGGGGGEDRAGGDGRQGIIVISWREGA